MRLKTFGGLWIENAEHGAERTPRPRGLALLAILAAAGPKGVSRDRVLGILWPESEPERARHALSQTVYSLRRDLGAEVVLSTPDLRLDSQQITSDLAEFRAAVRAKAWREAGALYVGPFVDGFYLAEAPEFERWAESERSALATDGMRAIEVLAKDSESDGRREEATEYWRRLTRLDSVSARYATSYMEALAAIGDRAGALGHGKEHVELLRREFDAEPDREVAQLVARLRSAETSAHEETAAPAQSVSMSEGRVGGSTGRLLGEGLVSPVAVPNALAHDDTDLSRATPGGTRRGNRKRILLAAGAVAALVTLATAAWRAGIVSAPSGDRPVLAVGRIRDFVTPDSLALGGVLSEMLATSLSRLTDLQVIANSRMLELTPRDADTSRGVVSDAARRAGANEILEGEVRPLADHQLLLEVRRVNLARGLVRRGYRVTGSDRIALFDSVTSLIAADLSVQSAVGSLAEISTRSPIAYRLYEEGLREFYQSDGYTSARLFRSALQEDSTFAMAAYYAWRAATITGDTTQTALGSRAIALASRASQRDRLLILTHIAFGALDARALAAAAETLATGYPHDPEALMQAGRFTQDLPRAAALLDRAIALDSAAGVQPAAVCRLCEAIGILQERYVWADSMDAALRTVDRWTALRPEDYTPWYTRAGLLVGLGRRADAAAALRRAQLLGVREDPRERSLIWNLWADDVGTANAQCDTALATRDAAELRAYRWYCTIGLRMQGRYRAARGLIQEGRLPGSDVVRSGMPVDYYTIGILDLESDRPLAAVDSFLALGRRIDATPGTAVGQRARNAAWMHTLAATAAVAGGDTAHARRLVDTIEAAGRKSPLWRDPLLHHFVRGLLHARAGQHAEAVRQFQAAMSSPTNGYTRINYELGKSLLALGRPLEAIPILRAPLHGGIEGSGLYLTRTETHELLARAFDAAGERDSAAVHNAVVERSWRAADPFLRPRYDVVRSWLAHAGRSSR